MDLNTATGEPLDETEASQIDWRDLRYAVLVGVVCATLKLMGRAHPEWQLGGVDALVAFLMTLGYIVARGRRQPEKLDAWGLTTPLSAPAIGAALALLGIAVAIQYGLAMTLVGSISFSVSYIPDMVKYIVGAFPQQFFMCSVGLVSLTTLSIFRGMWRLPLVVGLLFSLAHWWTPARLPGTIIPIQMLTTFPAGFLCTLYFLRFRTILPLTALHAIMYILGLQWVELHLHR